MMCASRCTLYTPTEPTLYRQGRGIQLRRKRVSMKRAKIHPGAIDVPRALSSRARALCASALLTRALAYQEHLTMLKKTLPNTKN
jgi:hypothetical protein